MELADSQQLNHLLNPVQPRRRPVRRSGSRLLRAAPKPSDSAPRQQTRNCRCGVCAFCLENERWERIFQAKFADPSYYDPKPPFRGSSLDFNP